MEWPSLEEVGEVLLLRHYNTRLVVLSTTVLGVAAGLIGTFLLLRKRSLMGDALSHATLPGIAVAFMVMVALGGSGKWLPGLLLGAALSGLLGVGCMLAIDRWTRLKSDTAMGVVLSVFFGLGIALLSIVQRIPQGSAAGLESFIYGKPASIVFNDAVLIAAVAGLTALGCLLLFKELTLLCFDEGYAAAQGWPVTLLDLLMLGLVTTVTVIGLQAVGLILVIALLIIPPAAARFWTHHLPTMLLAAALIGAACGWLGSSLSALVSGLPAGAIIVVVGGVIFVVSMIFGRARGVLGRGLRHWTLTRKVARQHLLRSVYERLETAGSLEGKVTFAALLADRAWSTRSLRRLLRAACRRGLLREEDGAYRLTGEGRADAARVVRNHRLWEVYLLTHADVAPSHVDHGADLIEHVLNPDLIQRLEQAVAQGEGRRVPASPHRLTPLAAGQEGGA